MKAIIDFDILRYEIGFGAETGWQTEGEIPPWDYVREMLHQRLDYIMYMSGADSYQGYLTEGPTFRFDIAKRKPYKGTRKENKPWHYDNLSVYMKDVLDTVVVTNIEADDAMSIAHLNNKRYKTHTLIPGTLEYDNYPNTILCTRDKDLRQIPGLFYSWELGRQPEFGPTMITKEGSLELSKDKKKIIGTGLPFFYSQVLTGDTTDNIPGLPGCGPVAAYKILAFGGDMLEAVKDAYQEYYNDYDNPIDTILDTWEVELLEQGRLCWMTRRFNDDGTPQLWYLGLED
ncbi:hypothetical protein LCGC14_1392860 [marine sediment metagenome]|uniref:5'-3' exonuclease domain-containing protein n=1 Tax=marine sediment metagenome TaxID=412755 RepID=A0A0F9KK82_9ZZZZ